MSGRDARRFAALAMMLKARLDETGRTRTREEDACPKCGGAVEAARIGPAVECTCLAPACLETIV